MHIGLFDLLLIYAIPVIFGGAILASVLVALYVVVKNDIGHLDFTEDVRFNIKLKKRPLDLSNFVQVMLLDSGIQAAGMYRLSRYLHFHSLGSLGMVVSKLSKYWFGVDVPPTAKIGPGVVFLHCGCNIVINPYCEIGKHVIIRPWVGLRGWGTVKLEDDVRIGWLSGVTDGVTMGKNSESAPGSIVTQDVPANHIAYGIPAKKMLPKPETKLRAVVLELESVLLESAQPLDEALRSTRLALGLATPESGKTRVEEQPPEKVLRSLVGNDPVRLEKARDEYLKTARVALGSALRLRPYARELLEKIRERGVKVAVISREPDVLAKEIADRLELSPFADYICGADDYLNEWKPQPWIVYRPLRELKLGVERAIYIAGSRLDMRAGIEAAVRTYWVTSESWKQRPGRGLVDCYPDLKSLTAEFSKPELPPTF